MFIFKWIKRILFVIVFLFALLLVIALFIPRNFIVESEKVVIKKSKKEVMDYLRILKNQEQYSEWVKADVNLKPQITGVDGEVGATQIWDSKDDNVGAGEQKIVALTEDSMIVDLHFKRPFESVAKAANIVKTIDSTTTQAHCVFWGNAKYPFNLMFFFMGKKMIADTELKNLQNVKEILEK